jgi:hypothetical protein
MQRDRQGELMRTGPSKRKRLGTAALTGAAGLLAFALCGPASGKNYDYSNTEINQMDAGGYASNNYYNGSGDSKDEGVRNAMRALNRLASLDIGGAIHYGYKGYGNYTNSQRMDDLDSAAWRNKGTMDSAAAALLSGSSGGSGTGGDYASTIGPEQDPAHLRNGGGRKGINGASGISKSHMLSDMDRGFLYRGETGEVAAEFEKKSGMSRETFFNELAATEASGLSWDDPNVMDKMESRYRDFVQKIPNKDYRANIEKMHDMFNLAKKSQLLEEAAAFYKNARWGNGGDKLAKQAKDARDAAKLAEATPLQSGSASDGDRSPASEAPVSALAKGEDGAKLPKLTKEQMGMYLGLEGTHGDELKDFIGQEDTIFRVVSKRYRKLTPMMIGRIL